MSGRLSCSGRWRSRWSSMPSDWRVPGFTSTASLRPDALFGPAEPGTDGPPPERITRAAGCREWDEAGREYVRSEEHTSELQSQPNLVCRLLLEKKTTRLGCWLTTYAAAPSPQSSAPP